MPDLAGIKKELNLGLVKPYPAGIIKTTPKSGKTNVRSTTPKVSTYDFGLV